MLNHDEDQTFELALHALRDEQGTGEQARALEQRLLDMLGPEALSAPPAIATAGIPSLFRSWLTHPVSMVFGVAVIIGVGVHSAREPQARRHETSERAAPHAEAVAPLPTAPLPSSMPTLLQAPLVVEAKQTTPPRVTRRERSRDLAPAPEAALASATPPLEDELTLLQRASSALGRDPGTTLVLAEQHARDYPAGMFAQEREMLAVKALLKRGRAAEAFERAARFIAENPSSAYAVRLREMLATKPLGAAVSAAKPEADAP